MSALQPVDGCAVVLHLIEAARAWARTAGAVGPEGTALAAWVAELEDRYEREARGEVAVGWEPRRWRELVAGDRVEIGGHEAVIASAMTQDWHAHPEKYSYHPGMDNDVEENPCRACRGACRETRGRKYEALEHSITAVRLEGRDPLYQMPPDGEVETLRGPAGRALDEVNGHRSRVPDGIDPAEVLGSWVQDAAATLEAAGLGPIEVLKP